MGGIGVDPIWFNNGGDEDELKVIFGYIAVISLTSWASKRAWVLVMESIVRCGCRGIGFGGVEGWEDGR